MSPAPAMNRRPWHWAREAWLEWCARRGGRTAAEIGAPFGLSKAAVILKAHRMGLSLSAHGGHPTGTPGNSTSFRPGNYPARWKL